MNEFILSYIGDMKNLLNDIDLEKVKEVIKIMDLAKTKGKRVFVMGNGGSASTVNHFACDLGKNAVAGDEGRFKIISLSNSVSHITAYGNDMGYENVFVEQLKNLLEPGDIIFAISASGNSPNIIKAIEYGKKNNALIVGLTGFDGGKLKKMSDISVHTSTDSYEKAEDMHLIITHIIVYWFKLNQQN